MSRGAPRWRPGSPRVSRMSPSTGSAHRRSARRSTWNTRSRPGTCVSVIACRVESMSRSGWVYMKGDAPFAPRGPVVLLRTMWAAQAAHPIRRLARDSYINMIEAARNVADRYGFTREDGNDPDARSHSEQLIPLRRLSAPEEFSPVAAFVLSPAASDVRLQCIWQFRNSSTLDGLAANCQCSWHLPMLRRRAGGWTCGASGP